MSFWLDTEPCELTYTAIFDTFVDTFFLVWTLSTHVFFENTPIVLENAE
jgi:hypothetical protein